MPKKTSPDDICLFACLFAVFVFSNICGLFNDIFSIKSTIQRRIIGCVMHNQLDRICGGELSVCLP